MRKTKNRKVKMNVSSMVNLMTRATVSSGIVILAGCASIVSQSRYPVIIDSNQSGATVLIKDKHGRDVHKGVTPTTVTLPASAGYFSPEKYTFQFEKEGYSPTSATISAGLDGWYFGNLLFGGLIGFLIVDPASGAMWELDQTVQGTLSIDPQYKMTTVSNTNAIIQSQLALPPSSEHAAVVEKLKKIKDLKEEGILTSEEYDTKRKELVEKL